MSKSLPTWVFVAGPYRSGSTTQYQITRDIIEETKNGKGVGYHTEDKLREFDVEGNKPYVVCKVFEFLPDGFRGDESYGKELYDQDRAVSVVSVRDPRDIMVSMRKRAHQRGAYFDFNSVAKDDFPIWLGNVVKWIDKIERSYWSRFEEFTQNLLYETRAIAAHLGIELDDDHAKDIAGRYSIRSQYHRKQEFKKAKPDAKEDPWLPSIPEIIFGTSGHWRTWLNGPERQLIEDVNRDFMVRFGYLEGDDDD